MVDYMIVGTLESLATSSKDYLQIMVLIGMANGYPHKQILQKQLEALKRIYISWDVTVIQVAETTQRQWFTYIRRPLVQGHN